MCASAHQLDIWVLFSGLCTCHLGSKWHTWGNAPLGDVFGRLILNYWGLFEFVQRSWLGSRACYLYSPVLYLPPLGQDNSSSPRGALFHPILRAAISHSLSVPFGIFWGLIRPHPPPPPRPPPRRRPPAPPPRAGPAPDCARRPGPHSPWLNHSSIVSQGSSSIAKKHKAGRREKRHGEKDVCECQGAVQQIFSKKKKKKSSFTGQERRKSEGEGEKRPKNRERGAQSERGKSAFEI